MKALLLKTGELLFIGPYDTDKKDNVLTYWCYPNGQTHIDVEYESYTRVKANEALWVEEGDNLKSIVDFVNSVIIKDNLLISINNSTIKYLLEEDFNRYSEILQDCFKVLKNSKVFIGYNEWETKEYHIDVRSTEKEIVNIKNEYSVFVSPKGYVLIKDVNLAFGNKVKEIHYVKELQHASLFLTTKLSLDPYDYHSVWKTATSEIEKMERKLVTIESRYTIEE